MPFQALPIYHKLKFLGQSDGNSIIVDAIHAQPKRQNKCRNRVIPGRFDTGMVNIGGGGKVGVTGNVANNVDQQRLNLHQGYRVVQVRVIFRLPNTAMHLFLAHRKPPRHLAYVEWFSPFPAAPEPGYLMYKVTRTIRDGQRIASILPVQSFRRSVHLFPKCGPSIPQDWTSSTVLDESPGFLVSPFSDRNAYATIR